MNFVSLHRNHENRRYEGSPPHGPSRGTAGQEVFLSTAVVGKRCLSGKNEPYRSAAQEAQSGAAAYMIIGGMGV
jgi:hypothetical protein